VVLALLSTVMAYKIVGPVFWYAQLRHKDPKTGSIEVAVSPTLLTSITASILNGVFIAIMTKIYMKVSATSRGGHLGEYMEYRIYFAARG
jgi:hypothetical protein